MMIDWLPHGWRWTTLGEVVEEKKERVGDRLDPVVLSSTKYFGLVPSDEYFVNRRIYSSDLSNYKVVYRGWFAYATNHLTEGSIGLQSEFDLGAVSPMYTVFAPGAEVDPDYLFRVVKSPRLIAEYIRRENATVDRRGSVRFDKFATISISLPPIHEQRLIAAILNTVDAAIQQTDALIAKLRQMKAGLLHDLLTRGLDENGELRDPVTHPEQFQESVLGVIPAGWEEITLGAVVARANGVIQTGPFGSQLHAHEYTTEGIPVIMPQDIEDGIISEAQIARISESKANSLARHLVQFNDVVFARRGDLSRCAAIGQRETGWFCGTGCLLVRADHNEIFGPWLAAVYQHDQSQRQILARAVGSTMVNLNTGLLSSLLLAKPTYDEQIEIMNVIDAHDARIRAEEAAREKLTLLKRGLMDDLLTGRVRVNGLEEKV